MKSGQDTIDRRRLEALRLKCRTFIGLCEFDDSLDEGVRNSDALLGILVKVSEELRSSYTDAAREIRYIRNRKVHSTESNVHREKTKEERVADWRRLYELFSALNEDLEREIGALYSDDADARSFEKFGGAVSPSEADRKQLVDALADTFDAEVPKEDALPPPTNTVFERGLASYLENFGSGADDARGFVLSHDAVSAQVQKELLALTQDTAEALSASAPGSRFFDERRFIERVDALDDESIAASFPKLRTKFEKLPTAEGGADINFDFFEKRFHTVLENEKLDAAGRRAKLATYASVFKKELAASFKKRYEAWAKAEFEKALEEYNKMLLEKIDAFRRLEKLLSPLIDEFSILWDMAGAARSGGNGYDYSQGFFRESDFNALLKYASLLEHDAGIRELAKLLGRERRAEEEYEKDLRDKVVIKTEYHPVPAYKGQINGVTQGDDISSLLPSELALYKHAATRRLFYKKFAEKQLLEFKYETLAPETTSEVEQEEVLRRKEADVKGPAIICVDTSGSMSGTPDAVAKTVAFALTKIALREKRKCYLISFSTAIETLDLTDTDGGAGIANLIRFLNMSFHGGTDATPALAHSLKLLESKEWKNADVLMVSDFQMGGLPDDIEAKIKSAQENKTRFHSLVIGNFGAPGIIDTFDNNWTYNPNSDDAQARLVRDLREAL